MKQLFNKKASQRFYALVFSCLFWHSSAYAEHLVDLQIDGVKNDALKNNIQIHLNAIDKEEADGSACQEQAAINRSHYRRRTGKNRCHRHRD